MIGGAPLSDGSGAATQMRRGELPPLEENATEPRLTGLQLSGREQ